MKSHAPIVFAFVLALCFLLLLVTFRSIVIPIKAVLLNLLSVGAAYGLLVLVFQHRFAEGVLGFHSNGAVTSWLPLFMFVILFGLSMDYHVFILSRIKELVDGGMSTEEAVATGIKRTAATVTSAALVMVAVFAIFMSLRTLDIKQMGFGLAAAILIDSTIVRAVLLPAVMKLLGDWNWYLPTWLEWLPHIGGETGSAPRERAERHTRRARVGGRLVSPGKGGRMKVEHTGRRTEHVRAKRRVLVVDDHAGFRSCASELLQAEGFEVVGEAEDGSSALARAAELLPELVLLDIQLPDLDGFEVAERLLAREPGARDRARLEPRPLVVRAARRAERRPRLRLEVGPLRGIDRKAPRVTETAHPIPTPGATARAAAPGLLIVAASATGGAVYLIAVSKIAPHPVAQSILTALVCFTFVGTGVAAIRLRPYARFGVLLAAVGFASLVSVLHEANGAVLYTLGVLASNVVFAVLVHALLAFPSGRLRSRTARVLVVAAYVDMLVLQATAVLFDPLTRYHSAHPRNVVMIASYPGIATSLEEIEAGIAAAVAVAVVVVLTRRVRAATAAARRQLVPVLYCGETALLLFSFGLILAPLSSDAGLVGFSLGVIAALALPGAFIVTLVQGRLSRAAVGDLLLELHGPGPPADLEDALRRALGDPSLRLGRLTASGSYIDCYGATLEAPRPGGVQVSLPIFHQGEPVGTLLHDRSLRLRRELLDAVTAAAGFALANERALHAAELAEKRHRALIEAMPDVMMRVARDGTYLDVRSEDLSQLLQPPEELIGQNVRDVLPPELAEDVCSGSIARSPTAA